MASKPETTFIRSIHRFIPTVYAEKMSNPWRGGTADVWYSGDCGDLWVEYKYIAKIPKSESILPDLTAQQEKWLKDRYDDGRNVAVVLGTPSGGVIYRDMDWLRSSDHVVFTKRLVPKKEVAQWIYRQVGASKCLLPIPSSQPPESYPQATRS